MLYQLELINIAASSRIPIEKAESLGITEKHIEEFIASHLVELIPEDQLMLIAQERLYQEEADIFALDRKGTLFIFELKRNQSNAENLLQVMRYGQIFGRYTYDQFENLVKRHQKLEGDLQEKHREYFDLKEPIAKDAFNADQRFVIVTNGVDRDTLEAIQYWSKKGVRIDSLTYKLYCIADKPYIQFDTYNPELDLHLEENAGIFVVNTNRTYMEDSWKEMLADGKLGRASAYYDRKNAVQRITRGSTVFLYHTGVGIIAKGKAINSYQMKDYDNDRNEEYFVPLRFEWALLDENKWSAFSPQAWEINKLTGSSHRFRQTVFSISSEISEAIDKIKIERSV